MRKKKPRYDKLLELAEFLRNLPRKRFDYRSWVGDDWQGKQDLSCGTTACALGWATSINRRLTLYAGDFDDGNVSYVKKGKRFLGANAASMFFRIPEEDAVYLFFPDGKYYGRGTLPNSPPGNSTPKQVAKHIERYVKAQLQLG